MSNNPNGPTTFATTITSGIQDISALLPLLGTDQCEHHVASALAEGYLYAAASPLSIFGIIGIAKAGIKTLLATFKFSSPSSQVTHGAAHLQDAGFRPVGESLALIMMDPDHRSRHLAESKFDDLYKKNKLAEAGQDFLIITPWKERKFPISLFHLLRRTITLVVASLLLFPILIVLACFGQVSYTKTWAAKKKAQILKLSDFRNQVQGIRALDWNTRLIAMTAVMSAISICPYIPLILTPSKLSYRIKLTFPILRAVGGLLVVICIQILIELRLSRILRCRLALHRLDHEVRDNIHAFKDDHGTPTLVWNYRHSAELCLESMHKYLQSAYPDEEQTDNNQPTRYYFNIFRSSSAAGTASRSTDVEAAEKTASNETPKSMQELKRHVAEERKKAAAQILWPYHLLLAVGIISLLVGYVGCFSVVQNTIPSKNPPIWLGLEAALSLLRLVLWASNPKFDDARPITVKLKCDPKPHLPCCLCKPQTITYSTKTETQLYRVTAWSRKTHDLSQHEYKELLWVLKAHSSSDWLNLVIPQPNGLGTSLNKIEYVHGSTTNHHLDLDILPESIARVLSDKDCQLHIFANSSSQDSLALKVYTSYLVRENAELELIVFAGCKTWLDKSPGHLERMRHRASHAQSTIKQRRSSLDKLLGLWLDHDNEITVLTRWHRGRILELDRLWASSFKRGLTLDIPAGKGVSSQLPTPSPEWKHLEQNLKTLRDKLQLVDFPHISIDKQNIPGHYLSWKEESDFRIGYAELQEYVNILPSESICFSGDNLNFDSLDPPRSQQLNDQRPTYALRLHVPTNYSADYQEMVWQTIRPVLQKLALTQDQRQRLILKACSHSNTPNQQILVESVSERISSEILHIPDSAVGSPT